MSFNTIALFGADGQIGKKILHALLLRTDCQFKVRCFVPPGSEKGLPIYGSGEAAERVSVVTFDIKKLSRRDLAQNLKEVDVVVSALNGRALEAQPAIQDAAADAGVKRFYPSEYGMHHIYRKPNDPHGYVHPVWNHKSMINEQAVLHPAILRGEMSFTIIGCGDFYDQDREPIWCPWTQEGVSEYVLHIIGNADAKVDFTHLDDFSCYLVMTLCEPEKSENRYLNFRSDNISSNEISTLLEKYADKPVKKNIISLDELHRVIADPSQAPKHLAEAQSAFPVDFWYLVKGIQGQGRFRRPPSEYHEGLFPEVKRTTFEKYLTSKFGDYRKRKGGATEGLEPMVPHVYGEEEKNYWTDKQGKINS